MSDGDLLIMAGYGLLLLITVARVVIAISLDQPGWRPVVWVLACASAAFYLEVTMPLGASLDGVMRGLIYVVAFIL